jgi:hypothetical protein
VLVECITHAILAANLGPCRASEWSVCEPLLAHLRPGMLCMADRGFNGHEHWRQAQATGAQLLWPWRSSKLTHLRSSELTHQSRPGTLQQG